MPGFDRTGPAGQGPMTGRGVGLCASDYSYPSAAERGRGWGFRFRRFWVSPKNNLRELKEEESQLKGELEALKDKIVWLEEQAKNE